MLLLVFAALIALSLVLAGRPEMAGLHRVIEATAPEADSPAGPAGPVGQAPKSTSLVSTVPAVRPGAAWLDQ